MQFFEMRILLFRNRLLKKLSKKRFEETGSVKNYLKTGRSTTNEKKVLDVLQSFVENLQISS